MLVKLGSFSPSRGENKKHLKPPPREAGKNMECVFKISGNSKLAKQISNSKNLEQIWIGCLSPKIMAQLLIGFPLKILPFPVSFAGVFLYSRKCEFWFLESQHSGYRPFKRQDGANVCPLGKTNN